MFLFHARGSLLEAETQIELARRLHYIDDEEARRLFKLSAGIGSALTGLINSLQQEPVAVTSN
jgi:four helix bundle protein